MFENPSQQQIFSHVLNALRKQGKASMSDEIGCAYRGEGGLKCAVGHLIPDELYDPDMENNVIHVLRSNGHLQGKLAWMAEPEMIKFLEQLQAAHDQPLAEVGIGAWETEMKRIATERGLIYTEAAC